MHLASGDISLNTFVVLIFFFLWWCSALWCSIYRSDLILALISESICDLSPKLEPSSLEIGKDCSHRFPYNREERWSMPPDGKETLDKVRGHEEPVLSHSHSIPECEVGMDVPASCVSVAIFYLPFLPLSFGLILLYPVVPGPVKTVKRRP